MEELIIVEHALKHGCLSCNRAAYGKGTGWAWFGEEVIMIVMTSKELEEKYGMAVAELDALSKDAENGIFHGEVREVVVGRPLMFGEQMKQVGFKEPVRKVQAIEARAEQLGMKRSDYLRYLVDEDLKLAGIV